MKIAEIMSREPVVVRLDQTFGEALQLLIESGHGMLPVVDGDNVYHGNFDLVDIWSVLLPKAVHLNRKALEDLSFLSSSIERMKDKLAEAHGDPVSRFVTAADAPPLEPESPVIQGILMLDEHRESLAVVDPATRKLLGMFGAKDVLRVLRGNENETTLGEP